MEGTGPGRVKRRRGWLSQLPLPDVESSASPGRPPAGTPALPPPYELTVESPDGTKRSRAPARTSVTDLMQTAAEQLWSGKTRGLLEFEWIAPTNGLPMGAIGVAVGPKGGAAFWPYLKQPKVIARLEAEGFERAGWGAPHPWYLPWEPGVVSPCEKALCRSLTDGQRARISRPTASRRSSAAGSGCGRRRQRSARRASGRHHNRHNGCRDCRPRSGAAHTQRQLVARLHEPLFFKTLHF